MDHRRFLLLPLALGTFACSGSAGDSGIADGPGTDAPGTGQGSADVAWPRSLLHVSGCVIANVDPASDEATYRRRAYDPEQRWISETPVDAKGVSIDDPNPYESRALYYRLDAAGRVLTKLGGGSGSRPFRFDSTRDEQGNLIQSRSFYGD